MAERPGESIIQLSIKARELGIDVDAMLEEMYERYFRELEAAILEAAILEVTA